MAACAARCAPRRRYDGRREDRRRQRSVRPGRPRVRPRRIRRQEPDHCDAGGDRRHACVRTEADGEPQVPARGRGGSGLHASQTDAGEAQGTPRGRCVVHLRRARTPEPPAPGALRRARCDGTQRHGVRTVARIAQRPLRQLGAEPRHAAHRNDRVNAQCGWQDPH